MIGQEAGRGSFCRYQPGPELSMQLCDVFLPRRRLMVDFKSLIQASSVISSSSIVLYCYYYYDVHAISQVVGACTDKY